jgi:hypothetical protein
VFPGKTEEFSIDVDLITDMEVTHPFDFFVERHAENWRQEDVAAYVKPPPRLCSSLAAVTVASVSVFRSARARPSDAAH